MACSICGRSSCASWMHSFEAQGITNEEDMNKKDKREFIISCPCCGREYDELTQSQANKLEKDWRLFEYAEELYNVMQYTYKCLVGEKLGVQHPQFALKNVLDKIEK